MVFAFRSVAFGSRARLFVMLLTFATISTATQQSDTHPQNQTPQPAQNKVEQPLGKAAEPTVEHPAEQAVEVPTEHPKESIAARPAEPNDSPQKAWRILKEGLGDHNSEKRAMATRVLALLPNNPVALNLAETALGDEKAEVRASAAFALGEMHSKRSIRKLRLAMDDEEILVVMASANSLRTLQDPTAYRVYYAVLTGERKSGKRLLEGQEKMLKDPKKLALLGVQQGIGFIPFGGIGFNAVMEMRKDDTSPVRAAAAKALAKDPDPRSAKALKEAALDKSWIVRVAALDAIAHRGDPALMATAYGSLDDDKDAVRFAGAAAALRLGMISQARRKQSSRRR
ncbi:MAG TPA: HEAT repeat domain-containing protein [Candidatus Saccharimonadales bacterium]|nr:HEAT repeat domain-containing protein [Candidatus Saccharimonadales bacterium]